MARLIILWALSLLAAAASAAPVVVQTVRIAAPSSCGSVLLMFPSPVTTGNSIIILMANDGDDLSSGDVGSQDSVNIVLTKAVSYLDTSRNVIQLSLWYKHNINASANDQNFYVCTDADAGNISAIGLEVSGLSNVVPSSYDSVTDTSSTHCNGPTVTPSTLGNMVFAFASWAGNYRVSGPTGLTRVAGTGQSNSFIDSGYIIQSTMAPVSTTWAHSGDNLCATMAAVFAAPDPPPPVGPTNAQRSAGFFGMN